MTGLNHGMTGAVIALTVKNPLLAVPLALASHFAQDALPHWDYGVSREQNKTGKFFTKRFDLFLVSDFLLSVVMMIVLAIIFPSQKWLIWSCMAAAACPDLMWAYYRLYLENIKGQRSKLDPLAKLHKKVQWSQTPKGVVVEIFWFVLTSVVILNLR